MNIFLTSFLTILCIRYGLSIEVSHIGCHKIMRKPTGCKLKTEDNITFSTQLMNASANGVEWIRQQIAKQDLQTLSWILASLRLTGYINDEGTCSNTFHKYTSKLESMTSDDVINLSGEQLALLLLSLKASCKNARNFKNHDLIQIMKVYMESFPKDEFNTYYQYSLGMIALYVHGLELLSIYGHTLLNGVQLDRAHKNENITETEALAVIALSALDKQKFVAHNVRKRLRDARKKVTKKIENILQAGTYQDVLTIAHLLQVLHVADVDISSTSYCSNVYSWLLRQQTDVGSFHSVAATTTLLPVLNGYSFIDLKNNECPIIKDDANKKELKQWIRERKEKARNAMNEKKKKPRNKKKRISVKLQVVLDFEKIKNIEEITVKTFKGMTVLDALQKGRKHNRCFEYKIKDTFMGGYLTKLCNAENNHEKKAFWVFYVNGKLFHGGVETCRIRNNDVITFKYMST